MLCASSQNPAELSKYSNFQLPNCNCKFLQYTLRRNFSLATILLLPCYRFTSIPPVNRIQNFQLSYHLIWLCLTYTQHIPCIYLAYIFPIPWHYFVFTKGIFCIKFVHYEFRIQNFQYSLIFHSCKNASQMQNEKTTQTLRRAESGFSMRIFL